MHFAQLQALELIGQNKVKICKFLSQNFKIFCSKIGCPSHDHSNHVLFKQIFQLFAGKTTVLYFATKTKKLLLSNKKEFFQKSLLYTFEKPVCCSSAHTDLIDHPIDDASRSEARTLPV